MGSQLNKKVLIDEGLISTLMYFHFVEFERDFVEKLVSEIPLPKGIIYMNISLEEIASRIQKRSRISTLHNELSSIQVMELTKRIDANLRLVVSYLNKEKEIPVFYFNDNFDEVIVFLDDLK